MKNFINRILDVPKLIRTIWFILWIILIILLVMKFCFGIWYPIVIKNESIMEFNSFIRDSWIKYVIQVVFYFISSNILYLITTIKKKYGSVLEMLIINVLILSAFLCKMYFEILGIFFELIFLIVVPIVYMIKFKKYYRFSFRLLYPVVIQLLIYLWMLNIFFIRDLDTNKINNEYFIFGFVLQLDYYIFIIITWIGVSFMGLWSVWIFSKDITVLKAAREKELARKTPNMETIAKIDKRIAELEKEGK